MLGKIILASVLTIGILGTLWLCMDLYQVQLKHERQMEFMEQAAIQHNEEKAKNACPVEHGEYQLGVEMDSLYLWDEDRLVGVIPWTDSKLDSLILKDNQ